jgi:UDP-N-acetylmuramate dehydrogenase
MQLKSNVALAPLSTLRVGGFATYVVRITSLSDLKEAVSFIRQENLPFFILGEGSNVLFPDEGYDGVVLKMEMEGKEFTTHKSHVEIIVAAGESWDAFVETCVKNGYWGIENLSGIPGTVGAVPVQNVGAYGTEAKDVILWVEVFDTKQCTLRVLSNKECNFSYRNSIFKNYEHKHLIITRVCFALKKEGNPSLDYVDVRNYFHDSSEPPTLGHMRRAICDIRAQKFPDLAHVGTAGSFFKNPIIAESHFFRLKEKYPGLPGFSADHAGMKKVSLAWILDRLCLLKGVTIGSVGTYDHQSLVFVTYKDATATELKKFAKSISRKVYEKTNITIEPEVTYV